MVQWAVREPTGVNLSTALIRFGLADSAPNTWRVLEPQYTTAGPGPYRQFRATLNHLQTNSSYKYSVGWRDSDVEASSTFKVAPRDSLNWSPRLAMFGDLGWTDNQILPLLREESEAGAIDALVLFGDMVYWDNGENENSFMRDLSNLTAGATP